MRKSILSVAIAALTLAGASTATAEVYTGNGATGFGGTLGNSTLTMINSGATIDVTLDLGSAALNNGVVLYVDSVSGGFGSTANFTDSDDGLRRAISGTGDGGTTRTEAIFATGFEADYAIAFTGGFAGLWQLQDGASHTFIADLGLSSDNTGATPDLSFAVNFADLGITTNDSLDFVGTLISETAFRADETIGDSTTVDGNGDPGNGGFDGTQTFASFESFNIAAVPEPGSIGVLVALGAIGVRQVRRKKARA